MARLRLGSRQSALAQVQARAVAERLMQSFPGTRVELVLMTTSGDQGATQAPGGLKALFTKELDDALLDGRIDLAVHSLKDVPAVLPSGLRLAAYPEREDPRDAWISRSGVLFKDAPPHARVATSAVRRQAQLRRLRPDMDVLPMRGNVDTRLRKLVDEKLDGLILAAAGLRRLGREKDITEVLPADLFIPAAGQGCVAIETREEDAFGEYWSALDHAPTRHAAETEREFLRALGGGCQTPVAAYAQTRGDKIHLDAAVFAPDGSQVLRDWLTETPERAPSAAAALAERLLKAGALPFLGRI